MDIARRGLLALTASAPFLAAAKAAAESDQDRLPRALLYRGLAAGDFGAVGDGVDDDTEAVQRAINHSAQARLPLYAPGIYRITAPLIVPTNLTLDGAGTGHFIKAFDSTRSTADAMFINENYGVLTPGGDAFNIKFGRLRLSNHAGYAGALMSMNNINGLLLDNIEAVRTTGGQGFTIHMSGENIEIISPTIRTVEGRADGLHFNYCKNVTITAPNIYTFDDCIAFTADPIAWASGGPRLPSGRITIVGGTLRSKTANGIRISNGNNNVDPDAVDPGQVFKRVRVSNVVFERDDSKGGFVNLTDYRSNGTDKHDDIVFDNCFFGGADTVRIVWLQGNVDPGNAENAAIRNYGHVAFYNCCFECGTGEIFGGGSASGQAGGGFEKLTIWGGRIRRVAATAGDYCINARQFGLLQIGGGLLVEDNCSGTGGAYLRDFDRIEIGDVHYFNGNASRPARAAIRLGSPNDGAVLVSNGLIARGNVEARIATDAPINLARVEISGGAAETTAYDVTGSLSADVMSVPPRMIARSATQVAHTGDHDETTLAAINVPANCMGRRGSLIVTGQWAFADSDSQKILKVKFGGVVYYSQVFTTGAGRRFRIEITNRDAANAQIGGPGSDDPAALTGDMITSAVDTTAPVSIEFTAQLADSGETVALEQYKIVLEQSG